MDTPKTIYSVQRAVRVDI